VQDHVPSLTSVLVRFNPAETKRDAVAAALGHVLAQRDWMTAPLPDPARRWTIPVAFGGENGPQLAEFTRLVGLDEHQAIAQATAVDLRVLAIGFAPGLPYLGLLPPEWDVPRQSALTPRVPAGALATAVRQMVLFPAESTTGWRQIGRTAFRPFIPARAEPFLLRPGDAIRLEAVSADTLRDIEKGSADGLGGAACEVLA
jgi:KipI family sensor histidine kinase inhibitor